MSAVRHVFASTGAPSEYLPLFVAAAERGIRVGWLHLGAPPPAESPFAELLDAGAFRVAIAGEGRSMALKSMKGPPVLRDLLREHFKGCRLVLVCGDDELPLLRPVGKAWEVRTREGATRRLSTGALLGSLARTRI